MWPNYANDARALIFVVDSADKERLEEARTELQKVLGNLEKAVVLVYANKQVQFIFL